MKEMTLLCNKIKRLQNSLLASIEYFRSGEDSSALDSFQYVIEDLEDITDFCQRLGETDIIAEPLPALRTLDVYIQNQDITGIADIMEYDIYPMTIRWLEEYMEDDNSQTK